MSLLGKDLPQAPIYMCKAFFYIFTLLGPSLTLTPLECFLLVYFFFWDSYPLLVLHPVL